MKTCKQCACLLPHESFHRAPTNADGYQHTCKTCYNTSRREQNRLRARSKYNQIAKYRRKAPACAEMSKSEYAGLMIRGCRARAKQLGIECTITKREITIPDVCPVLGISLAVGTRQSSNASPSIDRIDNTKGYVPGNVAVISTLANRLKSNASLDQLRALVAYVEQHTGA